MTLLHQLLERAAAAEPQRLAVECGDMTLTLSQLQSCSHSLALWLSELGISRGDRVIVKAHNDPMTVALIYAISTVGGCFIPVHPAVRPEQLGYIKENSDAVLVLSPDLGHWTAECGDHSVRVPDLKSISSTKTGQYPLTRFDPGIISEDLACMIYTSGSTGRPKGVTCLHRQMVFATRAIDEALDYRIGDRIFCALPLSFDYGLYQIFLAIESGAVLHLENPEIGGLGLFKALKNSRANVLPAVPSMIETLAILGKRKPGDLPDLRLITNTGAAPSQAPIRTLRKAFTDLSFQLMYGLTECKRVSITPVDGDLAKPGTCGLPLRGTRVEVVDDAGAVLPAGEVGEFVISGPNVMAGYWNSEDLTQKFYRKRNATLIRLHSGDFGWMDEEGYMYCNGRRDDIFKSRGFRVSCAEIEAACAEAPIVNHAVMVPPGPGRFATLFVCVSDTGFDLLSFLNGRLEPHKLPDKIRVIDEMPQTANSKFDRKALIRLLEDEAEQKTTEIKEKTYA